MTITSSIDIDPYTTLGLTHDATNSEIRKAYQRLALKYHPDRHPNRHHDSSTTVSNEKEKLNDVSKLAEQKMASINEAYSILKDEEQKRKYDYLYKYGGISSGGHETSFDVNGTYSSPNTTAAQSGQQSYHRGEGSRNYDINRMNHTNDPFYHSQHSNNNVDDYFTGTRSRRGKGGFSFSFTSTSNEYKADTGDRIHIHKTTIFQNGNKYTQTQSTTVHPDGRVEHNVTSHHEENATILGHFINRIFLGISDGTPNSSSTTHHGNKSNIASKTSSWYENITRPFKNCIGCS